MSEVDDPILYVTQDTLQRLFAQERATMSTLKGYAQARLLDNDPRYPNTVLLTSREITSNAVHRKEWQAQEQRYIFVYLGDI